MEIYCENVVPLGGTKFAFYYIFLRIQFFLSCAVVIVRKCKYMCDDFGVKKSFQIISADCSEMLFECNFAFESFLCSISCTLPSHSTFRMQTYFLEADSFEEI